MNQDINRLKVVLADKKRTNKWLAEQLGKDPALTQQTYVWTQGMAGWEGLKMRE